MAKDSAKSAMSGKKKKTGPKHHVRRMTIEHGGAGKGYVVRHDNHPDPETGVVPDTGPIPIASQDELHQHIDENMPEGGGMPPQMPQGGAPSPMMGGGQ